MSFNAEYQNACNAEAQRLRIAEKWANVNRSESAKQFDKGRADRLAGKICASNNGSYLNGYYSV